MTALGSATSDSIAMQSMLHDGRRRDDQQTDPHTNVYGNANGNGNGNGGTSTPSTRHNGPRGQNGLHHRPSEKRWSVSRAMQAIVQPIFRQSVAFFLFGLLNNSLYVVILTAALELIPKGTPTGVVAFFNIFPALVAKAVWPYVLKGTVRYTRRVWSCVAMNFVGLVVIATFPSLWMRLAGIGLASFSSGLGELTFLQLSTRFSKKGAGRGVGWFSSGTGAAGLVGASAWWIVRPLGVMAGLLSLSFLPLLMALSYFVILPDMHKVDAAEHDAKGEYEALHAEAYNVPEGIDDAPTDDEDYNDNDGQTPRQSRDSRRSPRILRRDTDASSEASAMLAVSPHASAAHFDIDTAIGDNLSTLKGGENSVRLSLSDKMALIRPMLFVFILPLVLVYLFEYTINQGVAPTLLYPLPTPNKHPLLSLIIKELKDYYPFYQLTYQTFVFLSRSSISIFRLPAIPKRYLWLPAIVQGTLLVVLITESLYNWFRSSIASPLSIVLICVEGLAGGSAYVSVFYQIGTDDGGQQATRLALSSSQSTDEDEDEEANDGQRRRTTAEAEMRRAQEHEFRIGCVGIGDSMGILVASLIAMPLELKLCEAQVRKGRMLCKQT